MLAFYFFSLVFSSILWMIYIFSYINNKIGAAPFSSLGITDLAVYLAIVVFPLFVLWLIFGYINQYISTRNNNKNFKLLFNQMKKNQDYSDLLARVLIEAEQQIKNGFALNRFDLLVADMNELLSEIIQACGFASKEQVEHLWIKVQNGGKWSFGRVIIEVRQNQPNFSERLFEKAHKNIVLSGMIMEFCARYQSVIALLEKHDVEKTFYNILETGVMGKVFSILSPVAAEIQKGKEVSFHGSDIRIISSETESNIAKSEKSLMSKFGFSRKKKETDDIEEEEPQKDAFSVALEKSFGGEKEVSVRSEPSFDNYESDTMPTPVIENNIDQQEEILTNTQKTLNSLKKEWKEMKSDSQTYAKNNENTDFSYPFGGWTDEENYHR